MPQAHRRSSWGWSLALGAAWLLHLPTVARAEVALLGGMTARPMQGQFNRVPVLHSNQPEEVYGPGILIDTSEGSALAAETGELLPNATFRFEGPFGLHLHHKFAAPPGEVFVAAGERRELYLATVLSNPGNRPVRINLESGAVRNSFEAPYLGDNLMGVKPLGPRPWNTGPGDATAVQLLRGRLDGRLSEAVVIPPRDRIVLFTTKLPALGVANALLKGRSDGPFTMAVVAAPSPGDPATVLATLDGRRLAPGRTYLQQLDAIQNRSVFSRVGGVALGDAYSARLSHDLERSGPLHVPLTSTVRTEFGSGEVQVNPLVSRMVDSSLDNVGTYGVRFDIDLQLRGQGSYALVLSHPRDSQGRTYTAFRGSIEIRTPQGQQDVHVGLRSGVSLTLTTLQLQAESPQAVRLSLVYPADATPGHLLSVISEVQLAQILEQERLNNQAQPRSPLRPPPPLEPPPALSQAQRLARRSSPAGRVAAAAPSAPRRPQALPGQLQGSRGNQGRRSSPQPLRPPRQLGSASVATPLRPPLTLRQRSAGGGRPDLLIPQPRRLGRGQGDGDSPRDSPLVDRYRQAVEAQEKIMRRWSYP